MGHRAEPRKCPDRATFALPPAAFAFALSPAAARAALPPAPADAAPGTGRTALHGHG
ncbi:MULTISPECIES: hypothetical protein [unclassified Streptomyces]|uniref:hypothetical protein n=1 Tax=unclassified Streptomyces TaxID=2593676 RepID=UPI0037A730F6